jgi:C4-dicarboxylate transporter
MHDDDSAVAVLSFLHGCVLVTGSGNAALYSILESVEDISSSIEQ